MTANADRGRNMERKSDTVRRLVSEGDYKNALRIAKEFRLGISKEDSDAMRRGYECIVHPDFYRQIGVDTHKAVEKAVEIVRKLYA